MGRPSSPAGAAAPSRLAEGTASIAEYGPQRVRVEVQAARESFLVLNDQGSSGWSATVSGRPAPIRTANVMVRAVRVPAGASSVVFRYSVPGLREGALVFAVSAALLLALLVARRSGGGSRPDRVRLRVPCSRL